MKMRHARESVKGRHLSQQFAPRKPGRRTEIFTHRSFPRALLNPQRGLGVRDLSRQRTPMAGCLDRLRRVLNHLKTMGDQLIYKRAESVSLLDGSVGTHRLIVALYVAGVLPVSGCGGGDDSAQAPTAISSCAADQSPTKQADLSAPSSFSSPVEQSSRRQEMTGTQPQMNNLQTATV